MTTEIIDETTVGFLGDARVAMGSIVREGTYLSPDGSTARGVTCYLIPIEPEGESILVGKGSIAEIDGALWLVEAVDVATPGDGVVRLRKMD